MVEFTYTHTHTHAHTHTHTHTHTLRQVGDELLEINGNSTEGMLHSDAITIIKHGGDVVKLIVRRVADENNTNGRSNDRSVCTLVVVGGPYDHITLIWTPLDEKESLYK